MTNNNIGKRLKERRNEIGLSAADLAEKLMMSKATIHRYESGEIQNIKMPIIETMAKALYVNPLWLAGLSEDKFGELTSYVEAYKNIKTTLIDFEIFVSNTDYFKYGETILDERDFHFLESWLKMAKNYFENR